MMRVEFEMRQRGITQATLANMSNVNRVTINKIVRGREKAWPKWRDAIAGALGWPIDRADELFEEVEVR